MKRLLNWLPNLWSNPLSTFGTVLTTVSGFALVLLFGLDLSGLTLNPYAGAFLLVGLPALFVLGLLLIPFGLWWSRRRGRAVPLRPLGEAVGELFATPAGRRKLLVVGALTVLNVLLIGGASQRALAWMSSPSFCGTACHGVMEPEWVTYHDAPHAQVACVDCHVGSGATFFVRSKIDGLRQVWRTLTDTYTRPVPAPVHSLRPSKDTCEQCHWSDRWHGDRAILRSHTDADQANTERVNVLVLKLGGKHPTKRAYEGIHWHADPALEVRYEALDPQRTRVGTITVRRGGKVVKEFRRPKAEGAAVETRTMDCIDCHNRPTHVFDASPRHALDRGFASGLLPRDVPWLKELGEPVLAAVAGNREAAEGALRQALEQAYREKHAEAVPEAAALDRAARGLAAVWRHNVFPGRGVTWGTYPNHIGHQTDSPALHGCFRCHDDEHVTSDGQKLSGECEVCHETIAQDEKPAELEDSVKLLLRSR